MRGVRPSWAPLPGVLASLGSVRGCRQGPQLAPFLTEGVFTQPLAKMGSYCMPGTVPGAREREESKKYELFSWGLHRSGRGKL